MKTIKNTLKRMDAGAGFCFASAADKTRFFEQKELRAFRQKWLLPEYQSQVEFAYIKGETLFLALKMPAFCAEFNRYKNAELLGYLRRDAALFPHLQRAKKIKAYVASHRIAQLVAFSNTPRIALATPEKSRGAFQNTAKNPAIHALFEKIRAHILRRQNQVLRP